MRRTLQLFGLLLMFAAATSASAQQYPNGPPANSAPPAQPEPTPPQPTQPESGTPTNAPPSTPAETITIAVQVKHGSDSRPIGNVPVFLRAARPRGPFEPTAPKPQQEWAGFADENGVATFGLIPKELSTSGLRVHAVTTYDGLAFESAQAPILDGSRVEVAVYEKGLDTSVVEVANLRTVVEIWERYLVFTQYWTLTNTGKTALDVKLLPDEKFEKGLAFNLPVKAQAINVRGPGESMVVNSTFYWKGVMEPGARVNLQVRFSMSARDPDFTYEQTMDWPTQNVEVVVPIQTRFEKMPRLDGVELRPPGFAETDRGAGIFDLRDDIDFVGARGLELKAGESFSFQVRNLPFERAKLPWVFLGIGLLLAVGVLVFAKREQREAEKRRSRKELARLLEAQRVELLDELVAVEKDLQEGVMTRAEAEFEAAALREQLALVLKKIEDLAHGGS